MLIKRLEHHEFQKYHPSAKIAMILANVNRDSKTCPEGFSELDFIPPYLVPKGSRKRVPQFDEAGNVAHTDVKTLSPDKQRDFLNNMFGYDPKKRKKGKRGKSKLKSA